MVIRRQTVPPPDVVLNNSAFDLMTDPRITLISNRQCKSLCNQNNTLVNTKGNAPALFRAHKFLLEGAPCATWPVMPPSKRVAMSICLRAIDRIREG